MYTHKENDSILDKWNEQSERNGLGKIEYDGVAYKGDIHTFIGKDVKHTTNANLVTKKLFGTILPNVFSS